MSEQEPTIEIIHRPEQVGSDYIRSVLSQPGLKHQYVNGFTIHGAPNDVTLVLERDHIPGGTLTMTYSVAKSLQEKLDTLLKWYSESTGTVVLSTDELKAAQAIHVQGLPDEGAQNE